MRDCTTLGGGELTCGTDVTSVPTYNVKGTNGQVVRVIKTASALTGSNGGTTGLPSDGACHRDSAELGHGWLRLRHWR